MTDLQELAKVTCVRSGQCPNCFEKRFNIIREDILTEARLRTVKSTMEYVAKVRALYTAKSVTRTEADRLLQVKLIQSQIHA